VQQRQGDAATQVLARHAAPDGVFVLRRSATVIELVTPGGFAMSSHLGGRSEQLQVELTLAAVPQPRRLLLGGLGLGYALRRAVADRRLERIEVVEIEPVLLRWHHAHLGDLTGAALADPRVTVHIGDVAALILEHERDLDAIALDVDNGPEWLLRPANAALYRPPCLAALAEALRDTGAASVWGAARSAGLAASLGTVFAHVDEHAFPVPRGVPDWCCVASLPRRGG
jgi:spermidine synthase